MKQILIGYPNRDGSGQPEILVGPGQSPDAIAKILNAADRQHIFPEGIQRLERVNLETVQTSTFISDDVTTHLKDRQDTEAELLKTRAASKAVETAQQKEIKATAETLRKAVITRNNLLGDKLKADVKLRNLIATPLELCGKNHQSETEAAQKSVTELEAKVAAAVAAYKAAEAAHTAAKNPKPETKN